jgi:uncharacterized protein YqgV (UPF0045/DUF77 family)
VTSGQYRLEFFVEPFIEGQPGPHVAAAVKAVESTGLAVEVGPFGSVASGEGELVLEAARELLRESLQAGASRISLQLAAGPDQDRPGPLPIRSLHDALDRMISAVESELGAPLAELPRVGKQAAVRMLDDQGAFLLRKAVEDVADAMGVTRITIYNYLNTIRGES